VTSNQVQNHSTTYGNNGAFNTQSQNQNTVTATGGGPNFQFNGKDASPEDMKKAIGAFGSLFGKKQELQNLGMDFAALRDAYHQAQRDRMEPMPEINMSSYNDGSSGVSSSG
jgi:hypothetical protein|tara:strand:- start:194 stop:529 length:336 start_codon:yes stop_codon:yes gene_type:complete